MADARIKILLPDPEPDSLQQIISTLSKKNCDFTIVKDGASAQRELKEKKTNWDILFLSPEVAKPSGLSVVKFAHQFSPGIPIFVMTSLLSCPDQEVNLIEAGITGLLAKPFGVEQMTNALGPLHKDFDSHSALELSTQFGDKVDEELELLETEFAPIQAKYFISGSLCLFDVYLKLNSKKFVKLLQAGDPFEKERLSIYLSKGVQSFYIRKEAQEAYVTYCDKISQSILKVEKVPLDKKFALLLNQCQSTLTTMIDLGVNNDTIAYSQRFTHNTVQLLQHLGKDNDKIGALLKNIAHFEHSSGVVLLAGMFARTCGVITEKNLENLGLACMLHDIGLYIERDDEDEESKNHNKKFLEEEEIEERIKDPKCFAEEKKHLTYRMEHHAEWAVNYLANIEGIDPLVKQIILQHHAFDQKEKGTWKGGAIHPMAEILAMSDRLIKILKRFQQTGATREYLNSSLQRSLAIFPLRTREIFSKTFNS